MAERVADPEAVVRERLLMVDQSRSDGCRCRPLFSL